MLKFYLLSFSSESLVLKKGHYIFTVNIVLATLKIKLVKQLSTQS